MKNKPYDTRGKRRVAWLGVLCLMARAVGAATTNTPPWVDSFETYTNGFLVSGTNGWGSGQGGSGVVTTNPVVVGELAAYTNGGGSFPLPGQSHERVLQTVRDVYNDTRSVSGGVVTVDFLARVVPVDGVPYVDPWSHYAFVVASNGHLRIWHRNTTGGEPGSTEWLELSNEPLVEGSWARFTIVEDYARNCFQVSVNGAAPLTDAAGWTAPGGTHPGSWFFMGRTNGAMSRFTVGSAGTNHVDDVVVDRRSLAWSASGFVESITNDGTIDNSALVSIGLAHDTFNATQNEDLVASGKAVVSGLASSLVAVVTVTSATQAVMSLTGTALQHEAIDSFAFSLQLTNTAFTLGHAWDVTNSQMALSVTFSNTPSLDYSVLSFNEAGANNGSIDNGSPISVTLTNGAFAALASLSNAVQFTGLPVGLTGQVARLSDTQVQVTLQGRAVQHAASNSVPAAQITFGNGAFVTVPASSVFHASTNFGITFADPSVVVFATNVVSESIVNDGSLNPIIVSLVNKTFNATNGENLVANGKVLVSNLPAGLGVQLICGESGDTATLMFTGTATSNGLSSSIANLSVTFTDAAFIGGNASAVDNYALGNLQIHFMDPRIASLGGTTFREISAGVIDNRNPLTITLVGETFTAGTDFFAEGKITQSGLPTGLILQATRDSATRLSLRLVGVALQHQSSDSVSNVIFTLQDSAFSLGSAAYVQNRQMTDIKVIFTNDTGFFNVMPYEEHFEGYASGFSLAGTNGWSSSELAWAVVTNIGTLSSMLESYRQGHYYGLPIPTSHTNSLYVQDQVQVELRSESSPLACLDFMAIPVPVQYSADNDTNRQFAFYVNTNANLVIWHRNTTAGEPGTSEWLTLTNSVSTSQWVRFTVVQDYANHLFQIRMNEDPPVASAYGWTDSGLVRTGSWFRMVQTNDAMSRFKVMGFGVGHIDDLTLRTTLPGFARQPGSVYTLR